MTAAIAHTLVIMVMSEIFFFRMSVAIGWPLMVLQ